MTRTKVLQQDNYDRSYGADPLYGRSNYACVHDDAEPGYTAAECLCAESERGMYDCPFLSECPYHQAKVALYASDWGVVNYAYWLRSIGLRNEKKPGYLFCDEAHELSDVVLDFAGFRFNDAARRTWHLPPFPIAQTHGQAAKGPQGLMNTAQAEKQLPTTSAQERVISWIDLASSTLTSTHAELVERGAVDRARACANLIARLAAVKDALDEVEADWYIDSGLSAIELPNGGRAPGIVVRPLTARHHFSRYFPTDSERPRLVLMSATIGDFETFKQELGLPDDTITHAIPSPWPAKSRPVYALNAPKMGYKSTPADYAQQAQVIADAIKSVPESWSGIIHVTRKTEAQYLARRLWGLGLRDRVWPCPETDERGMSLGTNEQFAAWERRKELVPNSIIIAWGWWEGFDGRDERICIAAKVPYPPLGDPYEKARMAYSGRMYLARTGNKLAQALGRTRRGNPGDYDTDETVAGLVCIADGNWKRVRKYLPQDVQEAIVEL